MTAETLSAKLDCVERVRKFAASYGDNLNAKELSLKEIELCQQAIMWASNDLNGWARGLETVGNEKQADDMENL